MKTRTVGAELFHADRWTDRQTDGQIQGDTKNANFWKTQQKLKKSEEKNLMTEIEPLQLVF